MRREWGRESVRLRDLAAAGEPEVRCGEGLGAVERISSSGFFLEAGALGRREAGLKSPTGRIARGERFC